MATQQLIDYIKQQKQQGIGDIEIKKALVSNGWPVSEIDKGFDLIQTPSFTPSFNRKNHFWLVSIIILCFMFGTSVLGYYFFDDIVSFLGIKKPEDVVKEMIIKMSEIDSFHYNTKIETVGGLNSSVAQNIPLLPHLIPPESLAGAVAFTQSISPVLQFLPVQIALNFDIEGNLDISDKKKYKI